jgi:DNA polymerase-3 subunit epsilon/exodeoxyribonuclease X
MLIFIDLETTGLESVDKIVSLAIVYENSYQYELVNEKKKISAIASSVHHITNEMITDKKSFQESSIYKFLVTHNNEENILVAHNISFDIAFLASAGFIWRGGIIDTLRVTKHLIPECEFFSLQILRYELKLYRDERALCLKYGIKDALLAHNALGDVLVTKLLFEILLESASEDEMLSLSFKKVLLEKFSFGKYKGRYIEEICLNDSSYVSWLLHSASDLDEDLQYSIRYYLEG